MKIFGLVAIAVLAFVGMVIYLPLWLGHNPPQALTAAGLTLLGLYVASSTALIIRETRRSGFKRVGACSILIVLTLCAVNVFPRGFGFFLMNLISILVFFLTIRLLRALLACRKQLAEAKS